MDPGERSDAGAGQVAGPSAGGVVARPGLLARLGGPARVTVVSAPAGSGKTVLLRSWAGQAGVAGGAAWVAAGHGERDPRGFWLAVVGALRATGPGSGLVQGLTAAPDVDGWAVVERLLTDLGPLSDQVWLVVDDVHELDRDALRQLELLIMRAPPELRFVLATRHDVRLRLHRLRLEGELAEIREPDLRFSLDEARELFSAAGVAVGAKALAVLHERTEGWAAGLRLAALSLAGRGDPEGFAAGFSGSERTVAEYLLAEVLDRQDERVRRVLLRTSVLERVNGELADLLAGGYGGERILQNLEQAGAFTVSLGPSRSWFRYHQMFADLLRLELRRAAPGEADTLHLAASGWFAAHGYPADAVRHAQAARDFDLAARVLADHWPGLYLDGQAAVIRELLAGFPPGARAADAELAALAAADELAYGTLEEAERYLGLAEPAMASVPDARRTQARLLLGIARLALARQRADLPAAMAEAERLRAMADDPEATQPGLGEDLRAVALISLGTAEHWTARFDEAERHLRPGVALARRIGRPFLEFTGLSYLAATEFFRSFGSAEEHASQAAGLAWRHGWTDTPIAGIACMVLGSVLVLRGSLEEAEPWVQRAERSLEAEAEPAAGLFLRCIRGLLELGRGRHSDALAAFLAAEQAAALLAEPNPFVWPMQALLLQALVRLGQTERVEQSLAELSEQDRERGEIRIVATALRLAQDDPEAAVTALAPVLGGSAPVFHRTWLAQAFLLAAIAQDALRDRGAAENALECALDLVEPDGWLFVFLQNPAPGLLARHARCRTAHASLIAQSLDLLAGNDRTPAPTGPRPPAEPLSDSELRVLRYLPTNLTGPEIARELWVSTNTVKTHLRNLYAKLGTHRRTEAVTRARDLGLLAPAILRRAPQP